MNAAQVCIGIDVGGTKIAAGLVDAEDRVLCSDRVPTPQEGGSADVVTAVGALVEDLLRRPGPPRSVVRGAGIGVPGVVDRARGGLRAAADTMVGDWSGASIGVPLAALLGVPVVVDNDANAFALGELRSGAGRGSRHGLYVSVGTGVGAGIVVAGALVRGHRGGAGEVGHMAVPGAGRAQCSCGGYGHLEAVAGGRAIERAYRDRRGTWTGLPAIAARAAAGEALAADVLRDAGVALGRGLASLANVLDPEVVVVGGGVLGAGWVHWDAVTASFLDEVMGSVRNVRLAKATLGASAAIVGAAALVQNGNVARIE